MYKNYLIVTSTGALWFNNEDEFTDYLNSLIGFYKDVGSKTEDEIDFAGYIEVKKVYDFDRKKLVFA